MLRQIIAVVTISLMLLESGMASAQTPSALRLVDRLIASDSTTTCDMVGWTISSDEIRAREEHRALEDAVAMHTIACDSERQLAMFGFCIDPHVWSALGLHGPKPHEEWLSCLVNVDNVGRDGIRVQPTDFAMVDARNDRHPTDQTVITWTSGNLGGPLSSSLLSPGQDIGGVIGFVISDDAERPLRIEWSPSPHAADSMPLVLIVKDVIDPNELKARGTSSSSS